MEVAITVIIALIMLIFGFALGWLVEMRMDLAYWRTYFKEAEETPEPITIASTEPPKLLPSSQEILIDALKDQVTQRDSDMGTLRGTIEQFNAQATVWREREGELQDEIKRQRQEIEALTEARADTDAEWRLELARREKQWEERNAAELAEARATLEVAKAQLNETRGQVEADLRAEFTQRENDLRAELARREVGHSTETRQLQSELERLKSDWGGLQHRFKRYRDTHPARLLDIPGISPQIQDDLRRAGIHTYRDLAQRTPDDLRSLLNPPKWRVLDFDGWIAQARQLAEEHEL